PHDNFVALNVYAEKLNERSQTYFCNHSAEEVDRMRGAPGATGEESRYRDRPVAESLDLFCRMKAGEFAEGSRTLRARIDMTSQNVWLRDPILYRIRHLAHHNTGDRWCVY